MPCIVDIYIYFLSLYIIFNPQVAKIEETQKKITNQNKASIIEYVLEKGVLPWWIPNYTWNKFNADFKALWSSPSAQKALINQLQKRTDIVAFQNGKPLLLVECKAPQIKITQKTFDQIFRYNLEVKAPFLAVTNGMKHFFAQYRAAENSIVYLEELPKYPEP